MSFLNKCPLLVCLSALLLLTPIMSSLPVSAGEHQPQHTDLIIYQNVPEVDVEVDGLELKLEGLRIYGREGYFEWATQGLTWQSSNKKVATVDQDGVVRLTGERGKTFISVTDGTFKDRIGIQYKAVPGPEGESKIQIIKAKGKRYQIIDQALSALTLEEKIGQMLMPDFRRFNGQDVTEPLPEIQELIKNYHLGGIILFRENVVHTEQIIRLVNGYQQAAEKFGLLLAIDQEGGIVTRLQNGTDMPGNMALGATRSEQLAGEGGQVIGRELAALGINMNLAPVVDVNNNPDNPVIGVRSFGEDPQLVADMGVAYTKGLQEQGVAATAKHFPGHGDTDVDSHLGLPEVPHDRERLFKVELYPFQQVMDAGVDAVMTAHVTFPKIDDTRVISELDGREIYLPATLSHKVLTGLIREEMGYDGVVITDAMNMKAISDHFGPVDAAIRAVQAGADIILMPVGLEQVFNGIKQAVEAGRITEQRINEAVRRILTLKVKRGIFKTDAPTDLDQQIEQAHMLIGSAQHKAVEREAAQRSITLLKNEQQLLPLQPGQDQKIVIVGSSFIDLLVEAVKAHHEQVAVIRLTAGQNSLTEEQQALVNEADYIIIGSYTFNVAGRSPDHPHMRIYRQIVAGHERVIGVAIRNPYDIMGYPDVPVYLAQYGFREASFKAATDVIFGAVDPVGQLPVTIPDPEGGVLFPFGAGQGY